MFILEGCSNMMSIMVKSRDWTVFSQSAMLVISRTQATVGQASIIGPKYVHAVFCLAGKTLQKRRDQRSLNTPQV